jgi:hypothetical protein
MQMDTLFLAFLAQHDDDGWLRVVDRLTQACHPVDQTALRIWFHMYPLALQRHLEVAELEGRGRAVALELRLEGRWRLADQIDTSHTFFFGHRYWPHVKAAVVAYATRPAAPGSLDLAAQVQEIARGVASDARCPPAEVVAITAVAVRTLQQVGIEAFVTVPSVRGAGDTPPANTAASANASASADAVVAARARDDRQGIFGRLRGDRRQWTVTFGEDSAEARFPLIHSQHLTTAAAMDPRDHRARDPRCTEGPIPVQCRSCSCGTCWVGVLGGAEKLSPVDDRERAKLAECGYFGTPQGVPSGTDEERPIIRLACMAQVFGAISIVIPPWNGQIGNALRKRSTSSSTGLR